MKTKGSYKSVYTCPKCKTKKEINQLSCQLCYHEHSFKKSLANIVKKSNSIVEVTNEINKIFKTNISRTTITRNLKSLNINLAHFRPGRGRFFYTIENTLIENSTTNQQILKNIIIRNQLLHTNALIVETSANGTTSH